MSLIRKDDEVFLTVIVLPEISVLISVITFVEALLSSGILSFEVRFFFGYSGFRHLIKLPKPLTEIDPALCW